MSTTIIAGNATNNGASISSDTAGTLQIQTGSTPTTAITVDASQNVGIGVTPSAWQSSSAIQVQDNVSYSRYGYGRNVYFNGSNFVYNTTGVATQYLQAAGAHQFFYATSGTAGATATLTEAMRIDSSGNVGIGTASPLTKLNVQSGTTGAALFLRSTDPATGTAAAFIQTPVTSGYSSTPVYSYWYQNTGLSNPASETIGFVANNAERMRIDSSGNLLVGTTSSFDGGIYRMELFGGNNRCLLTRVNGTGTTIQVIFQNGNGSVGSISTTGSSTSYATSSDYRLKESIAPMQNALNVVQQLKPVTYNWKSDGSNGQGFIAHELQEIVPECVIGEKDAVEIVDELDAEGKVIGTKEIPKYQGIDTSFLVATLTAAIQEQQAMIEELKTKVAALEAK